MAGSKVSGIAVHTGARIAAGDFIYPFVSVVFGLHPRDQLKAATNFLSTICAAASNYRVLSFPARSPAA